MLFHSQAIDEFVLELGLKENNSEKRRKITALALSNEEWTRVRLFCNILQVRLLLFSNTTADAWPYTARK